MSDLFTQHWYGHAPRVPIAQWPELPALQTLCDVSTDAALRADATQLARTLQSQFSHVVVIGNGGSSLCGKTLAHFMHFAAPSKTQLVFLENVDPTYTLKELGSLPLERTAVVCVSKSGETAEVLAHTVLLLERFKAAKISLQNRVCVITSQPESTLGQLGEKLGATHLDFGDVGGRFSIFATASWLCAELAGMDSAELQKGAAHAIDHFQNTQGAQAKETAATFLAWMQSGIQSLVTMPYSNQLTCAAQWYRQLWAESTGKQGKSILPSVALGSVDQHSQLQLYLDGPKTIGLQCWHVRDWEESAPSTLLHTEDYLPEGHYLQHCHMSDILDAQFHATKEALIAHEVRLRVVEIPTLTTFWLGAFLMQQMLEVVMVCAALSINPFDQPAVEKSKHLLQDILAQKTGI